ncbi:MAG: DJ-1/PfpI family protein [Ilumatobacteraceae bacterium]
MTTRPWARILLVVYDGVLADECDAFTSVLGSLDGAVVTTVGAERRVHSGPGGRRLAEVTFDEVLAERHIAAGDIAARDIDIVVVPGGIGCERATDDDRLRSFLRAMEHRARFIAASSTGTVVLAAAGLLRGESAATHWLADDLLRRHGSDPDDRRLVVTRNILTCEGRISAVDAAFSIVERVVGRQEVERIRSTLLEQGRDLLVDDASSGRVSRRLREWWNGGVAGHPVAPTAGRSAAGAPVTPISVMIELVDDDDVVRRLRRRSRGH